MSHDTFLTDKSVRVTAKRVLYLHITGYYFEYYRTSPSTRPDATGGIAGDLCLRPHRQGSEGLVIIIVNNLIVADAAEAAGYAPRIFLTV